VKGKIVYNTEDGNSECRSTSGVLDTLKLQDGKQKWDSDNVFDTVDKNLQKDLEDSQ